MTDLTSPLSAPAPADRFLSWPEVRAITGLSRTTIWRLQRTGQFPQAVRISPGRIAWRASEVAAWLRPDPFISAAAGSGGDPAPRSGQAGAAMAPAARRPQDADGRRRKQTRGEVARSDGQLTLRL